MTPLVLGLDSLANSSRFLKGVLADASDAIVATNNSQVILLFNKAAEEIFGFSAPEVVGSNLEVLLPERARSAHRRHMESFLSERGDRRAMDDRGDLVGRRKDGSLFPVEVTIAKIQICGSVVFTAIVRDVSERLRLEEEGRRRSDRFRALFQHSRDAILVVDRSNIVHFATPSSRDLLGYTEDEPLERDGFAHVHPDDVEGYRRLFDFVSEEPNRSADYQLRVRHHDGVYRWIATTVTNLLDEPSVAGIVVNASDVTAKRETELALRHQAFHDELTGLPNRALLAERLTQALVSPARPGDSVSVLFIDLDRFKRINDSLGHWAADQVLIAVADRIRGSLRATDTLARIGGDEFVIVSPGAATVREAVGVAARVARCLHDPILVAGASVFTSASVGIVLAQPGDDPERVLANADIAMYQAKESGRGCYEIFDEVLRTRMRDIVDLEQHLRLAVQRREFVIHYQPVVALADETVQGVEALVRWSHPQRGLIMPDQFISVAEESGLIVDIGQLVLHEASRAVIEHGQNNVAAWDLAVNVSPRQLEDPGFVAQITTSIAASGIVPHRLILEITESAVIKDIDDTVAILGKLKDVGVRVAMDDFGTGFSSLSYLSQLPVDIVKIDRSFINTVVEDSANTKIVAAICSLSRAMGFHVIAEGVETRAQHRRLQELGCDSAQGYLYGRPRPSVSPRL